MNKFYTSTLNGAKPVIFKPHYDLCPNDCGGEDFDTVEYEAHCPTCDKQFSDDELFAINYCSNCGTKLWKHYKYPQLIEKDNVKVYSCPKCGMIELSEDERNVSCKNCGVDMIRES